MLDDQTFRTRLLALLERTGRSQRALSAAFGRDPTYVQALLDPTRPSRARPTPADLVRASEATGIPFVELLELLWDVPAERLAQELVVLGIGGAADERLAQLSEAERRSVADYISFLAGRHRRAHRRDVGEARGGRPG
ncbi:MAG: hypothetical protein ACP5VP_09400 [Candidatus Limnocylindrales bacterium]